MKPLTYPMAQWREDDRPYRQVAELRRIAEANPDDAGARERYRDADNRLLEKMYRPYLSRLANGS